MYDESLKKNPHHIDYMIYVVEDDVAHKKLYFFLFTFPTPIAKLFPLGLNARITFRLRTIIHKLAKKVLVLSQIYD